jgi:type II secretory pathway predicted ATPase ExeA
MYYEYWGLKKPAFDNVPDPSMYVDCHASMENAIAETLFAIEEGDECIAVLVGDVGLGKTMSIRMIIDSLDQVKYKIVLITNPGISFVQLLQEIIGQLTGKQCEEKRKVDLLEIFNRELFSTFAEGRKILIFIDEANAITPINLENLRLLTNMQGDRRNLFTMVLAGQNEFARRLEHPKRANLFQRVGAYNRIDKLENAEKVRTYVETRLMLAGTTKRIFTDDAFDALWEQSDHGVPRLVNKLSKLCLKAGETNHFEFITGEIVDQVGSRFYKLAGPAIQKRRSRRTAPEEVSPERADRGEERGVIDLSRAESPGSEDTTSGGMVSVSQQLLPEGRELAADGAITHPASGEAESVSHEFLPGGSRDAASRLFDPTAEDGPTFMPREELPGEQEQTASDSEAEMSIGKVRIKINLPRELMKQSVASSLEGRFKLAGGVAAETMKKHHHLIASQSIDPVPIWVEIRDFVLSQMAHESGGQPLQ